MCICISIHARILLVEFRCLVCQFRNISFSSNCFFLTAIITTDSNISFLEISLSQPVSNTVLSSNCFSTAFPSFVQQLGVFLTAPALLLYGFMTCTFHLNVSILVLFFFFFFFLSSSIFSSCASCTST